MLRVACVAALLLAGCVDPEEVTGSQSPQEAGHPCDYELDDYAGGQPRLMVHWDLDGRRDMSGIEMEVTVYDNGAPLLRGVTTTDCILFDMTGLDADRVHARETRDADCVRKGAASHAYGGDFETVKVDVALACG